MAFRTNNVYLNTLCLAAWAPGDTTMALAKAAVKMYDGTSPEERSLISPLDVLYVKLLRQIIDGKLDLNNKSEAQNVILQYQEDPAFTNNKVTFVEFRDMLIPEEIPSQTKIKQIVKRIKNFLIFRRNSQKLRCMLIANQKASMEDDEDKQNEMLQKILDDASEFSEIYNSQNTLDEDDSLAPVEDIDFDNVNSIVRGFQQQQRKRVGTHIKFGLQGFNRLFGPSQGAAYGEFFVAAARSHNYKSGLLMDMCRWQCVYNKPPDTGNKVPLILFISLENEIGENLHMWWQACYINTFHKMPDTKMTFEEMATQVQSTLMKNGFHIAVHRKFGDNFGFDDFVNLCEKYEAKGFKVVTTYLDYLGLCKPSKLDADKREDQKLVYMARRFKDYAQHNNMFFATGWQMDSEASRIKMSGQTNIVRHYSEAHLRNAKSLKDECDILIFMEIEVNAVGVPYLTFAWNKHKYVHDTPQEWKATAYQFNEHLGLLDDINGEDQSVSDIYAETDSGSSDQVVSIF